MATADSKPGGIGLIVVNTEFNRKRACGDKAKAESIWKDVFKFHVQSALNVEIRDFQQKLIKVKEDCIKDGYKNMAIVISSHGMEKVNDQGMWCHHIRFKDGLLPTKQAVVDPLSCKELRNVNKFIIIEACRTRSNNTNTKANDVTDARATGDNPGPGEDKGALVHITQMTGSSTSTKRTVSLDMMDGDFDGDTHGDTAETDDQEEPYAEMFRLPRSIIMFGAASGRIAYREDPIASWLIQEWYNEVVSRRSKLMEAKSKSMEIQILLNKLRNKYSKDESEQLEMELNQLEDQLREHEQAKEEVQHVSFIDMAVNVTGRISKRESVNKNKAAGCIIYSVLEDVKLRLHCREPPSGRQVGKRLQ